MSEKPPIIGLAGGVGSGKSTVAAMLRELGCFVTNSDEQARAALRDPMIKQTLFRWWGQRVMDASTGEVNRSAVASIVFNDPEERRRLEGLTHPWIEARRREEFAAAPPDTKAFVIDAPLLFEAGLDRVCDAVIFVDASVAVRQARVQSTRGWDIGELIRRESAQMPLDLKRKRAHHVVQNDGDLPELKRQVSRILEAILTIRRPTQS